MAIRDNLSKGGSKKKLFEALQYSGLVTEDMTFDEMCEVLAGIYLETIDLLGIDLSEWTLPSQITTTLVDGVLSTSIYSNSVTGGFFVCTPYKDITGMTHLLINGTNIYYGNDGYQNRLYLQDKAGNYTQIYVTPSTQKTKHTILLDYDVSSLVGEYRLCVYQYANTGNGYLGTNNVTLTQAKFTV